MSIVKNVGRVACVPRGTYDSSATYNRLDIVAYAGNAYICKVDNTTGVLPTNTTKWIMTMDGGATYLLLNNKVTAIKEKTDLITVDAGALETNEMHIGTLEATDATVTYLVAANIDANSITLNGGDITGVLNSLDITIDNELEVTKPLVTQENIVIDGAALQASEVNTNDLYINNVSKTEALDMLSVTQDGDLYVNGSLTVDADITNTGGGITTAYLDADTIETNGLTIDGADRAPALALITNNATYLQTNNLQVQNSLVVGTHNVGNELQTLNEKMVKCTQSQYDTWSALGQIDANKFYFIIETVNRSKNLTKTIIEDEAAQDEVVKDEEATEEVKEEITEVEEDELSEVDESTEITTEISEER